MEQAEEMRCEMEISETENSEYRRNQRETPRRSRTDSGHCRWTATELRRIVRLSS